MIDPELDNVAKTLLGKTVYIDWPYLHEAFVIGVANSNNKIFLKDYWKSYSSTNIKKDNLNAKDIDGIKEKIAEASCL